MAAPMIPDRARPPVVAAALLALYWIPAAWFSDQVQAAVNASFFLLSAMTAYTLIPDMIDVLPRHGNGMSWQAVSAKVGLFVLTAAFSCARLWEIIVRLQGFPDYLIHSPVGGFFAYLMGLGMLGVFIGFNFAGELTSKITPRGAIIVAVVVGIVIGLAIGRLPV